MLEKKLNEAVKCKYFSLNDSKWIWGRQQRGPMHSICDTENRELCFVSLQRVEKRAEGASCGVREAEWAEIGFIRGGEHKQSVISILTLPLEEGRSCCCDKGPAHSWVTHRILINPLPLLSGDVSYCFDAESRSAVVAEDIFPLYPSPLSFLSLSLAVLHKGRIGAWGSLMATVGVSVVITIDINLINLNLMTRCAWTVDTCLGVLIWGSKSAPWIHVEPFWQKIASC